MKIKLERDGTSTEEELALWTSKAIYVFFNRVSTTEFKRISTC